MDSSPYRRSRANGFARRSTAYFSSRLAPQKKNAFFSSSYDSRGDGEETLDQEDGLQVSHLSVYGNPLWSEDQSPSLEKEGMEPNVESNAENEADVSGRLAASSAPNGYLSYSTESSDGEEKESYHGSGAFLNSRFDPDAGDYGLDGKSTTSHSGSIYDVDSSNESSRDFIDREMMLEKETTKVIDANQDPDSMIGSNNFLDREMLLENRSLKAVCTDRNLDSSIASKDLLEQGVTPGSDCTESIDGDNCLSPEELKAFSREERMLEKHKRKTIDPDHERKIREFETHDDFWSANGPEVLSNEYDGIVQNQQGITVADGRNEGRISRNSMLWSSFEGYKKDLSTLSEQDEDFLYRNSEMLAEFEIEEHCNLSKKVNDAFNGHGIKEVHEDQFDDPLHEAVLRKNETSVPLNFVKHQCQENRLEASNCKDMRTVSQFDDTSSWITNDSEVVDPEHLYGATFKRFNSLCINNEMPRNHIRKAGQETPVSDDTNVSLHRADCDDLKARKQEAIVMKNEIKETKAVINAKALEEEIHRLQMENERLERLLKEKDLQTLDFSKERALWEQKKLSEMSIFNAFKEEETQRLRKERIRLEKQTKLLAQLPTKKERNEIEELQKKIANITSDCAKKESLQNLTISRLRRTIATLTEQIQSLQDEVKRYERFLQSEWGADSRKMINFQTNSKADKIQTTPPTVEQDDVDGARKIQGGSRVSTTMYWTRPQH